MPPAAPAVFTLKAVAFDLAEESRSDTVGRVDDLEDYFQRLLNWEGQPATALVAAWEDKFVQEIKENFRSAFERAAFRGKILKVEEDISNQAVGNRVAEFFTAAISPHLSAYRVEACSGPGYPDKKLIRREGERVFVLELKATSELMFEHPSIICSRLFATRRTAWRLCLSICGWIFWSLRHQLICGWKAL